MQVFGKPKYTTFGILVLSLVAFLQPAQRAVVAAAGEPRLQPRVEWISNHHTVSNKYGYIDQHGRWVIKPQFDAGGKFAANGLAAVRKGNHCYYIDKSGRPVIKPRTSRPMMEIDDFSEGLAAVWFIDGKCGYIDTTGRFVIEPCFDTAGPFVHGLARVAKAGRKGFIDENGKAVVPIRISGGREGGLFGRAGFGRDRRKPPHVLWLPAA